DVQPFRLVVADAGDEGFSIRLNGKRRRAEAQVASHARAAPDAERSIKFPVGKEAADGEFISHSSADEDSTGGVDGQIGCGGVLAGEVDCNRVARSERRIRRTIAMEAREHDVIAASGSAAGDDDL